MKIKGVQNVHYPSSSRAFEFETLYNNSLHFDASQSTLTVKNPSGSTILAIKQVGWYSVSESDHNPIPITWGA